MAKSRVRRVPYTPRNKKARGKSRFVLGVDPGLSNTGLVVMKKYHSGRMEVIFSKTIRTKAGKDLRERIDNIATQVVEVAQEYKVDTVICEAFEVRSWQQPRTSAQSMSKLINGISLRVLEAKLLFGLSSPDMKKRTHWDILQVEMKIGNSKIVKSVHAKDAGLHVALYLRGDLIEKLGIN